MEGGARRLCAAGPAQIRWVLPSLGGKVGYKKMRSGAAFEADAWNRIGPPVLLVSATGGGNGH